MKIFTWTLMSLLLLSQSLLSASFGAEDFLILLRGESSKSALVLHEALSGPSVETAGTVKTLLLDPERGTQISCDSAIAECSLSKSGFIPSEGYYEDQLMRIKGTAARKLFESLSAAGKTSNKINLELGTSGKYGTDILHCVMDGIADECQLIRTYCYYPGC